MAIRAIKATKEGRPRDKKRKRIILVVGKKGWHITRHEATKLFNDLKRLLRKKPHRIRGRILDLEDHDIEFEGPYLPCPGDS